MNDLLQILNFVTTHPSLGGFIWFAAGVYIYKKLVSPTFNCWRSVPVLIRKYVATQRRQARALESLVILIKEGKYGRAERTEKN